MIFATKDILEVVIIVQPMGHGEAVLQEKGHESNFAKQPGHLEIRMPLPP